ncbi:HlyD family efflux transporter periplasmic adaptor subunit [Oceanospirillum sp. HFRX-1_2]
MGLSDRSKAAKPFIVAFSILFIAISIFALLKLTKPKPEAQPFVNKRWPVSVTNAEPSVFTPQVKLLGKTESPFQTQVTSAVNGYVTAVHALEGDLLPEGDVLIELDTRDSQILLQQRKADLDNQNALLNSEKLQQKNNLEMLKQDQALLELNQASVQRLKALVRQGSASQSSLDEAQQALIRQKMTLANRELSIRNFDNRLTQITAQRDKAKALYQQAQLDLERTRAKAPFDARVSSLMVAPGDRVSPGKALATLYSQNQMELRAQLPNDLLTQLNLINHNENKPQSLRLQAEAHYQGQRIPLVLRGLSAEVRAGQGGIDALFRFSPESPLLKQLPIGQALAVTLYLPPVEQAIALPGTAFYGQNRIYLVEKDQLVSHEVKRLGTIQTHENQLNILISAETIPANSQILITQLPNAITGLPVRIVSPGQAEQPAAQQSSETENN